MDELFDKLPRELRAALLSRDNAETISQIAKRYKIAEEQTPQFAALVGNILLGLLPPDALPKALEQEIKIPAEQTVFISQEVNRLILYPVKDKLADFYKQISFAPSGAITRAASPKTTGAPGPDNGRTSPDSGLADIYRETVE
ncbi:MAG: hypothetical protein PHU56_00415 [Candidatus Pacebacteria bacterium]|nr:hypothetical protein [Candidatus Paceibacterota bacterium]